MARTTESVLLMLSCWASLCVGTAAAPGDCTPIEAASYLIDPRTRTVTSPAVCEADPSFNASADCERRNVPPIGPEYARSTATLDACHSPCQSDYSSPDCLNDRDRCQYRPPVVERAPDDDMIATKAAAVALSSPNCTACAAQYEVNGGFDECEVSADESCRHSQLLVRNCVGGASDLTPSELAYAYALDDGYPYTDCLAWSSETDCALGSTAEDGAANICQWDPSQPNGRKCSVKSVILSMLEDFVSCYHFTVPSSASDCTAVGPWCVYEMMYDGSPRCSPRFNVYNTDGTFEFAMREAYNAAPFVVVPPPPPDVDCAGTWSACTAACELASARTWTESTAQAGAGDACPTDAADCAHNEGECAMTCADFSCDAPGTEQIADAANTEYADVATCCMSTLCGLNEYVSSNACTACAAGSTRPAGDDASGADTTCTVAPAPVPSGAGMATITVAAAAFAAAIVLH